MWPKIKAFFTEEMSDEQREAWRPMAYAMLALGVLYFVGGAIAVIYTHV